MKLTQLIRTGGKAKLATYLIALWKLFKHPQTPRPAKWVAIAVVAYALSPIDLIPDFIPILGMLDDIVLLPLGIALAVRLTPQPLWDAVFREAEASALRLPRFWSGTVFIVLVWMAMLGLVAWLVYRAA